MKICLAQTKSIAGDIQQNIENHKKCIDLAIANHADLIVFPELSLTSFEPKLAKELAFDISDSRLTFLQEISDLNTIIIVVGLPTKSVLGIHISMGVFQPNQSRQLYSKQQLHQDELLYFVEGQEQLILTIDNTKIALAICYEALQPEHIENSVSLGAEIYIASVAKPQNGIDKANAYFHKIARQYSIPIFMVNSVGFCDDFESVGQSSIWGEKGILVKQLDNKNEGILIFDTQTKQTITTSL